MRVRALLPFCVLPLVVSLLWVRSEFRSDLVMRRSPVRNSFDSSRGVVSTRGCIIFRRIVRYPSQTNRVFWDWMTTQQSQLPDPATAANRLGFGSSTMGIGPMTLKDSWIPYWLAEIIAVMPLLVAIPYIRASGKP